MEPDAALVLQLEGERNIKYLFLASLVIFLFDYFYTLDEEIVRVWPGKIGLGKTLFYISRYTNFIDHAGAGFALFHTSSDLSPAICRNSLIIQNVSASLGISASEGILVLSLYALLGAQRKYMIILSVIYIMATIAGFSLMVAFLIAVKPVLTPSPWGRPPSCSYAMPKVNFIYADYFVLLGVELALTVVAITLGFKKYRRSKSPLIATMFRGGLLYYVALSTFNLLNVLSPYILPPYHGNGLAAWAQLQRVMHAVLATQLFLNIRRQGAVGSTMSGLTSPATVRYRMSKLIFRDMRPMSEEGLDWAAESWPGHGSEGHTWTFGRSEETQT